MERIQDNSGHDRPSALLIVGGNGAPGRVMGAGRVQTILVRLHLVRPAFPLVNVREAEQERLWYREHRIASRALKLLLPARLKRAAVRLVTLNEVNKPCEMFQC
jgi:hypothetical protein